MGVSTEWDWGGVTLVVKDIKINASTPGAAGSLLSTTELGAIDGITAGTATASKAVVLDASKGIATITSATITTLTSTAVNSTTVAATTSATVTSASAVALAVGLTGATNSAFVVDSSTASQAAGLKVTGATAAGNVAVAVISSGGAANLTVNALGTGTIGIGSVSTGTVTITPAQVLTGNTTHAGSVTLAAGTTALAPMIYTSGTNMTTPTAGSGEFDGKVFYKTAVSSTRQVVDTEQFQCLASNYSATDTASAQKVFNASTNGAVTLPASTAYFFDALYLISNTGTTSHTWSTLFAGTASFTSIAYEFVAYTGTTSGATITAASAGQAAVATAIAVTAASTSATEFVSVRLNGIMRINAGGTVIPQFKASAQPGASGTPGVTVLAGSYFRCWPVGADTVTNVGNWS